MKWHLLVALGLLLAPLAVAEHGPTRAEEACAGAEDHDDCIEDYCAEHPSGCRGRPSSGPGSGDEGANASRAPSPARGGHVAFEVDLDNATLRNFTVGGQLVLDAIAIDGVVTEYEADGLRFEMEGDDWRLRIQDTPTGNIHFKGNVSIAFDAPDGASWLQRGDSWHLGGGMRGVLVADFMHVDGDVAMAAGFATFHVSAVPATGQSDEATARGEAMRGAADDRRLGAEVKLRGHERALADNASEVEILQYDDVEVLVDGAAGGPLRVVVSADLTEGRTIVLDIDAALLNGSDLVLRYFDLHDDGSETEVVFGPADGIEDVLNASDDGGQPEYLVITEAGGDIKVLVSVPHWSAHAITIASVGEFLTQPSVLIGIGAGLGGVAVAALVMLRPRRDEAQGF